MKARQRVRTISASVRRGWAYPGTGHQAQRGVAAIEFSLILSVLLLLLYGLISFGLLFWMQQKVAHISGDIARRTALASMSGVSAPAVYGCDQLPGYVEADFILHSLGAGRVVCQPLITSSPCLGEGPGRCATITVIADVSAWPVLKLAQGLARVATGPQAMPAMLTSLQASAVVRIVEEESS